MKKPILAFIIACCVAIVAVGCGGSGTETDRIVDRIRSLISDANREDLTDTMRNYSLDYCDDVDFCGGGTYEDERDCWINTFNDPLSSVRFSNLRVIDVQMNQAQTEGYVDAIVHFTVYDQFGNFVGEDDYEFRMFMIHQGNEWLMWGDGNCVDSPKQPFMKWKDRVGKMTQGKLKGQPTHRR